MVQRIEWVKWGVGEESPWDKEEYEEWVKGWRMTLMHSFLFDRKTQDLAEFRPKGILIPPADEFIRIDGASPFFCLSDIVIYHEGLAEVPWIEADIPGGHVTMLGGIWVGTFI